MVAAHPQAASLSQPGNELLDFDDIVGPLRHAGQRNLGLHNLDIDTIVGSVGRVGDFDRWFRPRRPVNRQRWEALDRANRTGAILPPIEVYKGRPPALRPRRPPPGLHRPRTRHADDRRTRHRGGHNPPGTTLAASRRAPRWCPVMRQCRAVAATRWRNAAPGHLPWRGRHLRPARPGVQAARFGWSPAARPG
jgi:hypothetical protein